MTQVRKLEEIYNTTREVDTCLISICTVERRNYFAHTHLYLRLRRDSSVGIAMG
jgi:hypothetical protein